MEGWWSYRAFTIGSVAGCWVGEGKGQHVPGPGHLSWPQQVAWLCPHLQGWEVQLYHVPGRERTEYLSRALLNSIPIQSIPT